MAQQAIEVLNDSNLNGAKFGADRNARDRVDPPMSIAHISNLSRTLP